MSIKFKVLLIFLGVYLVSNILTVLLLTMIVKGVSIQHSIDRIDSYVTPVIDLYRKHYKHPRLYVKNVVDELASEDVGVVVINKRGEVVYAKNLPKEPLPFDPRDLVGERSGARGDYIFLTKRLGGYSLIFLSEIDISYIYRANLLSFLVSLAISAITSLLIVLLTKRVLEPLTYLTGKVKEIYEGNMDVDIERVKGNDEFSVLINTFADMLEKLRRTFTLQREFIANFAHTLKTPLTYIRGQLDLLSYGLYEDREKFDEVVRNLQVQSEKMFRIINNLMLLMRLESGIPVRRSKVNLMELFAELDEEYDFLRRTHNFRVEYPHEDVEVFADKEYLKIAIGNLIENSYKYTPQGGLIRLYYDRGCVIVEDTGVGIEDKERVFDRFYRENTEKEGFGLGLSIVKAIADLHGFGLGLESERGKGTKVSLCFFINSS
ncbi:signal transduction histidine kinase [Hydrogenivirga caldilitoris]|uniref:histidine kinase n=1 Tax=Hydrogenivirga caldilitoris TaxID=246264 RepID=A0A497XRA4_9AQUI|nr:HAMP domain-containing sensor histidine kinase [Hydrogenivirga caldilitoris]RLJ71458.1 signal transduction histidine kinase [Hydrogenivirga caldilitoris]